MKNQVGKAGLFFNPYSEKDMAKKIHKFWTDEELRKNLILGAKEKAKEITLEGYAKKWQEAISEALNI